MRKERERERERSSFCWKSRERKRGRRDSDDDNLGNDLEESVAFGTNHAGYDRYERCNEMELDRK